MKFEIKNNKIYRKGEEIRPNTNGTGGKVVQGTSAKGLCLPFFIVSLLYHCCVIKSIRIFTKDKRIFYTKCHICSTKS